jgi:hypothetical protein
MEQFTLPLAMSYSDPLVAWNAACNVPLRFWPHEEVLGLRAEVERAPVGSPAEVIDRCMARLVTGNHLGLYRSTHPLRSEMNIHEVSIPTNQPRPRYPQPKPANYLRRMNREIVESDGSAGAEESVAKVTKSRGSVGSALPLLHCR